MSKKEEIIIGAGEVYLYEFIGETVPENTVIEIPANNVGHCSGGFSVEYKPDIYDVKNQYGKIVKRFIKGQEITAKTGILSWNLENIALISAAKYKKATTTDKKNTLTFGGSGDSLKTVLLRFVHQKENGNKIRFTMIGQGGNGFNIEFADSELVVDAEITAIEKVKNFLASLEEETA